MDEDSMDEKIFVLSLDKNGLLTDNCLIVMIEHSF
jgi:hypothetical protein